MLTSAKEILQGQFTGMYLYGSLSSGDFDPNSSDIDFLVVTKNVLSDEIISELKAMHNRIWDTGMKWASKLEGAYIPKRDIHRYEPDHTSCPTINEGKFYVGEFGSDWIIQRHVIRENGIVPEGPDPKTLIDYVSPDEIRSAIMGILNEWWFPMLDDASRLKNHDSHYHGFTVVTMCRALHALEHRTIASKPAAIQWAKGKLDKMWMPLIEKAEASQSGVQSNFLSDTVDFVRYTMEQINEYKKIRDHHTKRSGRLP